MITLKFTIINGYHYIIVAIVFNCIPFKLFESWRKKSWFFNKQFLEKH